jgi:hypothetical protein
MQIMPNSAIGRVSHPWHGKGRRAFWIGADPGPRWIASTPAMLIFEAPSSRPLVADMSRGECA